VIRARFTVSCTDFRPVRWPIKHPYWCTGYRSDNRPVLVAYADDLEELMQNWPDAVEVEAQEAGTYTFTDRFPKPEWLVTAIEKAENARGTDI